MIRPLVALVAVLMLGLGLAGQGWSASYPLLNGDKLEGEPIAYTAQGLIVKRPDGTFAPRVGWTNFTQSALITLSTNAKIKPFVADYIEVEEPEDPVKKALSEIRPKIPNRLDRPDPKAGFGALFSSSLTVTLLLLLYAANVYAGFEIAIFRNYPFALVCGVAVIAPVIGPVVFLCLPTRLKKSQDEIAAESMARHAAAAEAAALAHAQANPVAEAAPVEAAPAAPTGPQVIIYQRGTTTFNRRFFETKFAGFLRMVPGDAEKDMVIHIKSSRGEHSGPRIARIQPSELFLQINKAGATSEVMIPFTEIMEVQVRPKDV